MSEDAFDLEHLPEPRVNGNGNGHSKDFDVSSVGVMRMLASDLMSRSALATTAGITFGGSRDLYSALGYKRALTLRDFRDRYNRGDIAQRIVGAFPKATWSGGAEIVEDEDPETETALEADWESINKRLQPWTILNRADTLAGLGYYAVVFIGAMGKPDTELPKMNGPDDVLYLAPYGPEELQVLEWEDDPLNERYGLPRFYQISRSIRAVQGTSNQRVASFRAHWTRIVHIADGLLDDRVHGTPRLEGIWNQLDNLDKVLGGGSEAFWLRANQGVHWDVEKDVKIDSAAIDKLKEEGEEFAHQMRRSIATRGVKLTPMGSDVAPFKIPMEAIVAIISGTTGIPQRILLGSERGELASTQDKENWNERVKARRDDYGEPIVRQLVDRLIQYGAITTPADEEKGYEVRWPEIAGLSMEEQGNVATAWAGLSSAAGGPVVTAEEIRDRVLRLPKMDEQQIADFQAKEQAKKDEAAAKLEAQLKLKDQNPQQGGFPPKQPEAP